MEETEKVLTEIYELKIKSNQTQADLLLALENLNNCSKADLREIKLMTENYMKIAINKEKTT